MTRILISHELPGHITNESNHLLETISEVSKLVKAKTHNLISEECSVDLVDLNIDQYEYHSEYLEDTKTILLGIRQTLFSSLFISIYSHLETNLSHLVKELESKTHHRIKSKHLKRDGSFIKCCLNYLTLVQNIDLKKFNSKIKYFNEITYVRNIFAHSRGVLPKEDSKTNRSIINFMESQKGIEIKENTIVITDSEFIKSVVGESKQFLITLINHINGH